MLALSLTACENKSAHESGSASQSVMNAPSIGESEVTPRRELMLHVMQRNAEQLWDWTVYSADAAEAGYSAAPKTDEDWMDAESDALTIVQMTKLLQTDEYRIDDAIWPQMVINLREAAQESATAAQKYEFDGMLAASDKINAQCVACHMHYVPEIEVRPR